MRTRSRRLSGALAAGALAALAAGCGGGSSGGSTVGSPAKPAASAAARVQTTRVQVIGQQAGGPFNPSAIYRREGPGVVTVISVLPGGASPLGGGGGQEGLGSGFVVGSNGEIATNAHVVTSGQGQALRAARAVYVEFADGNRVPAKIVGYDPNADVALIRVDPAGLTLRPLTLGSSNGLVVGSPVAAIGSPFGEQQSLSVGVISATNRTISSLNGAGSGNFQIPGAIQTDAAINHGNSGGPLVDGRGQVIGINSQIQTTGGGGEGVGFSVPVDLVRRSLAQLRAHGKVAYAYLGVSTVSLFPQLAARFKLPVTHGAWVQAVRSGPAAKAGIVAGHGRATFESTPYSTGGDVITKFDGTALRSPDDLNRLVELHQPGETATLEVWRAGRRRDVRVKLGARPLGA